VAILTAAILFAWREGAFDWEKVNQTVEAPSRDDRK
jgi:hypothetical protein